MRRKTAIFLLLTVILMTLSGIVPVCYADTEKGDTTMEQLVITLDRMHNRCLAKWEKPSVNGSGEYTAIIESVDESWNAKEAIRTQVYYNSFDADHYVAYACQENGFPYMMRVRVEYYNGDQLVAEGVSDTFDPREVFPEKEVLEFGTDIPLDAIRAFSWDSSGMSIESNWHISVAHYGDDYVFYSSHPPKGEKEKKMKKSEWDQIVSIIGKGKVERDYIRDPEMIELDGGGEGFAISWNDEEHENWQTYYVYTADAETEEELQKWLEAKEKGGLGSLKFWSVVVPVFLGAVGAVITVLRSRA